MNKNQLFKFLVLLNCLLFEVNGFSQDLHNVGLGGYGGITSTLVNPALMTGSKVYWDINILSANAFLQNNMYYFPAGYKTVWNLLTTPGYAINEGGEFKFDRTFNYYNNTRDKYLSTNEIIMGPSAMVQKGKHSFGVTTALRSVHTTNNVPYQIPISLYDGNYDIYNYINFDDYNYSFVSMTWGEIGFSYAYDFYKLNNQKLTFGVTAKLLLGYESFYTSIYNFNYIFSEGYTIDIINFNSDIAYSLPIGYEDLDGISAKDFGSKPIVKGIGQGVDIGLVYTKTETVGNDRSSDDNPTFQPYKYRIGLSIMDIGGINFNKKAAVQSFDTSAYWQEFDTVQFRGVNSFMGMLSEVFYGDSTAAYSADKFRTGLPTKISLQFDYKINENFYVAALWTQPIQINLHSLYSVPLLSVIPRFEKKYIGISFPVSLYNYRQPAFGLAIRVYSFTIGTEMLNSWFNIGNLTGVDIYFSLKINLEKVIPEYDNKGACYNADFGSKKRRVKK